MIVERAKQAQGGLPPVTGKTALGGDGMRTIYAVALSDVEVRHLLTLLRDHRDEGSYYGNQRHHYARTARLMEILAEAIEATA